MRRNGRFVKSTVGCDPRASQTGSRRESPRAGTAHSGGSNIDDDGRHGIMLFCEGFAVSDISVIVSEDWLDGDQSLLATAAVGLFLERTRCCVESVCVLESDSASRKILPDAQFRELSSQDKMSDRI
jgi:hypothetical protein